MNYAIVSFATSCHGTCITYAVKFLKKINVKQDGMQLGKRRLELKGSLILVHKLAKGFFQWGISLERIVCVLLFKNFVNFSWHNSYLK